MGLDGSSKDIIKDVLLDLVKSQKEQLNINSPEAVGIVTEKIHQALIDYNASFDLERAIQSAIWHDSPYAVHFFGWVDYVKEAHWYRMKIRHDIMLKDGTVYTGMYPNGNGWHMGDAPKRIDDSRVVKIRISKQQTLMKDSSFVGWTHPEDKEESNE